MGTEGQSFAAEGGIVDDHERILRDQLIAQLEGGQAYLPVVKILEGFPVKQAGSHIDGVKHTPWELLEHLRIAQWDILFFTVDPNHVTPPWPQDHWPKKSAPDSDAAWSKSVATFLAELEQVKALALNPEIPLFETIPHGTGQTYLREILLVADHNAHHLGQLILLRRALESISGN